MAQPTDQDYYVARAATSRAQAQQATNSIVAAIHSDFATRYEMLADGYRSIVDDSSIQLHDLP